MATQTAPEGIPFLSTALPIMKSERERVSLPLMPEASGFEMDIYARFIRHVRDAPTHRMESKILSAIHSTADQTQVGEALIAKTLVDLGLLAPRRAFPADFLDFADRAAQRTAWEGGRPPQSVTALQEHWEAIGEDRFAHIGAGRFEVYGMRTFAAV